MPAVLITAPYMLPFLDRFKPVFDHYGIEILTPKVNERLEEADLLRYAGQFDGTLCGDDRYTATALKACAPRLKIIAKWGTGIDSIDQKTCAELGIQVKNTPNAFTLPVSDSVLAYMLTFARRQVWMDRAVKAGVWQKIPGKSLSECTLGVIGVGHIGKAVLRRAQAFGMTLLGNDILPVEPDFVAEHKIKMTGLADLLVRADFVSVNCDLNPTSYHLINAMALSQMSPEAVLINTARGPIVDEAALVEALTQHKIAGAALDVFEIEPLPADSALRKMENVLLAPHNSNSSPAAWERVHWNTLRNLLIGLNVSIDDFDEFSAKL